jgi:hypothetical protein
MDRRAAHHKADEAPHKRALVEIAQEPGARMTFSDLAYYLFTIFNGLRLVSYLPQIYKIAHDANGASAISYSTWFLWTAANGSTAVYSFSNLGDITMGLVNGFNALCCAVVVALTAFKHRQFHSQVRQG